MTNKSEWTEFLKTYAAAVGAKDWPGNPGASEEQLSAAEKRLKAELSPSYRAFLTASNGWRLASRAVPVLRATEEIRWFRKEHADWVEAYTAPQRGIEQLPIPEGDYFNYGREDSVNFDASHLAHTLCLSEVGDSAVLLLNPMVVWPDGEWEAWFFANWLPGAIRYRSFADWMRKELTHLVDDPFEHANKPGELPTVYLDPPSKAKRRIRPREEPLILAAALERLTSKKRRDRLKASQQLSRLGGRQAIDALLNTLKNDSDHLVRCEAARSLGCLGEPEAIDPLIATIEEKSSVSSTAIHAFAGFHDERSAQYLLKLVAEDGMLGKVAVYALARRGDSRPVQHLIQFLTSKDRRHQHTGNIAGRLIANFEEAGYVALEPLMTHPETEIRRRAIAGVGDLAFCPKDKSLKLKARALLQRCLESESDAELRKYLETAIEITNKKGSK